MPRHGIASNFFIVFAGDIVHGQLQVVVKAAKGQRFTKSKVADQVIIQLAVLLESPVAQKTLR